MTDEEAQFTDAAEELVDRFLESSAYAELTEDLASNAEDIVNDLLYYAEEEFSAGAENLDEATLRELLLDVLPAEIAEEEDYFQKLVPVVQTFLTWLEAEDILDNGAAMAKAISGWTEKIVANAGNPENWAAAKAHAMGGGTWSLDIDAEEEDEEQFERFTHRGERGPARAASDAPAEKKRTGRNHPCPCGSGKKYKKCCGKGQA